MNPARRAVLHALALVPIAGIAAHHVAARAQDPRATIAAAAARDWLALVDKGDVAGSHAKAGARFRSAIDAKNWNAAYHKERASRGAVVTRTMVRAAFESKIPNAPPGEYVLLLFRTAFSNQNDAGETVTLERDANGVWQVVGYLIR